MAEWRGFGGLGRLGGRLGRIPKPRLGLTTFQRRPTLQRRTRLAQVAIQQAQAALELRAAQDVPGELSERIVVKTLRILGVTFDYNTILYGGFGDLPVDFLIFERQPPIALEVLTALNKPPRGFPYQNEEVRLQAEARGMRYATLEEEADIFPSQELLEQRLQEILGQPTGQYEPTSQFTPPTVSPATAPTIPAPEPVSTGGAPFPNNGQPPAPRQPPSPSGAPAAPTEEDEEMTLRPLVLDLQRQITELRGQFTNHGSRHLVGGQDGMTALLLHGAWEYDTLTSNLAQQRLKRVYLIDGGDSIDQAVGANADTNSALYTGRGVILTPDPTTGLGRIITKASTGVGQDARLTYGGIPAGAAARPQVRAAENPWFKALIAQITAPVGGTQDYYAGLDINGAGTGLRDGIYFRSTNAANWFLVCRNSGTESTVDLGVAPTTTYLLLELRVDTDGARVQAYVNGAPRGLPITTNIPTGLLYFLVMQQDNRAATVTTGAVIATLGWGYARDLIP